MMKLRFFRAVVLSGLISCGIAQAQAETATATAQDSTAEAVVLGQVIQQQQAQAQHTQSQQSSSSSPSIALTGEEQSPTLPALNAPVIDPMQLLSASDKAALSQKILEIYQAGKAQIGIVVVPTTGQQDIFSYSLKIAEDWGLGSEKYDNGLLIVVAVNDRRIQILTGYGLEGVLPDIVVNRLINTHIAPQFKANQYGRGLAQGLTEIDRILSLDPDIARQAADQIKMQQELAQQKADEYQSMFSRALIILIVAAFASAIVGRKFAGVGAGVAGIVSGLIAGSGIVMSLLAGGVLFFLIFSSIAQTLLHVAMSLRGGGGGGRGGGFGGGGFGGGGGGFGGGGASGSW